VTEEILEVNGWQMKVGRLKLRWLKRTENYLLEMRVKRCRRKANDREEAALRKRGRGSYRTVRGNEKV
jgi:hypothetical protein